MSNQSGGMPPYQYQPPSDLQRKQSRSTSRAILVIVAFVIVVVVAIVIAAASGGGGNSASSGSPQAASTSARTQYAVLGGQCGQSGLTADNDSLTCGANGVWHATGSNISSPSTSTSPPPAAPSYTVPEQQAIDSAESYISDGNGFSKAGLYQQLHSSYGEGFSARLARFAVNHIHVNWYHQAVLSAQSYMQTEPCWSYSSLVQQLDSPYGEQFTVGQAEYAAKAVGL